MSKYSKFTSFYNKMKTNQHLLVSSLIAPLFPRSHSSNSLCSKKQLAFMIFQHWWLLHRKINTQYWFQDKITLFCTYALSNKHHLYFLKMFISWTCKLKTYNWNKTEWFKNNSKCLHVAAKLKSCTFSFPSLQWNDLMLWHNCLYGGWGERWAIITVDTTCNIMKKFTPTYTL